MPLISQASIQELNDRLDAVAVVSEYVHIEKKAGRFWACCPFHQEKTASFTVNPELKSYYCFGCHKGGSIVNFVMEMDKLSFPEAIEVLAKKTSVELKYENSHEGNYKAEDEAKKKAKEQLFELYSRIRGTFHHFLLKKPESEAGKSYIIDRGINAEMIERFQLGFAPADRYWLYKFLSQKGYSGEFLASSGLFSPRHPELSFFSDRIMFPISDRQGRTIAFGGRVLPSANTEGARELPKYINSPELGIYKKRETLYGLDLAISGIRSTKTAYIAEGYLDVIALHQAGITNALAPLGTAFTDEQAKLLKRWAEKIIFFFDTDRAGQEAAVKGIYTCRKNGLECSLVSRPDIRNMGISGGRSDEKYPAELKDPADILLNFGPDALQKTAKCFISDFEYLILRARLLYGTNGSDGQSSEGKARAVAFLFPYMDLLESDVTRSSCVEAAADAFGLLPSVVSNDYRHYAEKGAGTKAAEEASSRQADGSISSPIRINDELSALIAAAVNYISPGDKKLFLEFRSALEISELEDIFAKDIFIALEECVRYGETGINELLERISNPELKKLIAGKSASDEFSVNAEELVAGGIKLFRCKRLKRKRNDIIVKIREIKNRIKNNDKNSEKSAEEYKNEIRELLADKMKIDSELNFLENGRPI